MHAPKGVIRQLKSLQAEMSALLGIPRSCLNAAQGAYRSERERAVNAQLGKTPLRELSRFTGGRVRFSAIEAAGLRTVSTVVKASRSRLESIEGVGPKSSVRILVAARRLRDELCEVHRVRFDIDLRPETQTRLLTALRALDEARRSIRPLRPQLEAVSLRIDANIADARFAASSFRRLFASRQRKQKSNAALERMAKLLGDPDTKSISAEMAEVKSRLDRLRSESAGIWDDYAARAATYNGLLAEVGQFDPRADALMGSASDELDHPSEPSSAQKPAADVQQRLDPKGARQPRAPSAQKPAARTLPDEQEHRQDEAAETGTAPYCLGDRQFLPEEIAAQIKAFELDVTLLGASLRGYQAFGAKFALIQERTILGDEMGLGKTIEALAVMCHLQSHGATHFLVICPASVLANWEHEIPRHSQLATPIRLHGQQRDRRVWEWARKGGVAITTLDTLRLLRIPNIEIAAVVVDEAHYVKNPQAKRTRAIRACLRRSRHVMLMSGTPLENRLEEFETLIRHVQPEVATKLKTYSGHKGSDAFRRAVAPVYLRRNQVDVLDELPPKIETVDWLTLDGAAANAYREAVASGNFMAMRRAAFMTDDPFQSPKLTRLIEIVQEAVDNNRKVVVYSFFRDVLDRVYTALEPLALGPLTGSVTGPRRQELVDQFSASRDPAVLVSQIDAGGIGLNIQAASVVILAEPQWKPSAEEQAIARCHRMGQIRSVEVHRLLTENSVDEHMLNILAAKSALFAEYIRPSALKEATPEAIQKGAVPSSQQGLEEHIIELERRRLGLVA